MANKLLLICNFRHVCLTFLFTNQITLQCMNWQRHKLSVDHEKLASYYGLDYYTLLSWKVGAIIS